MAGIDFRINPRIPMPERGKPQFPSSTALCEFMRDTLGIDHVLLAFSCGKDSLAAWCKLLDHGFKVTPYYQVMIPGNDFVEKSLAWYENHFDTEVHRILHPNAWRWLNSLTSQPPWRRDAISSLDLPAYTYAEIQEAMRRSVPGMDGGWVSVGTRIVDSPIRRMNLTHRVVNQKNRSFFPVFDFLKKDIISILTKHKVKLPIDYEVFGRSFDGIDHRYCEPLSRHFPESWENLLFWYPMQGMELFRADVARKHGQAK
jgi:hypothetical protein